MRAGCMHACWLDGWLDPRVDRVNRYLGDNSLGDEKRLVFGCPHLQPIRSKYAALFRVPNMIQSFLAGGWYWCL